jgi:hypothetical protein
MNCSLELAQVVVAVEAGRMAIAPDGLPRVTADKLMAANLKAGGRVRDLGLVDMAEHVGLAATRGTGTEAAQRLKPQISFLAITPRDGEFVADDLEIYRGQRHEAASIAGRGWHGQAGLGRGSFLTQMGADKEPALHVIREIRVFRG